MRYYKRKTLNPTGSEGVFVCLDFHQLEHAEAVDSNLGNQQKQ